VLGENRINGFTAILRKKNMTITFDQHEKALAYQVKAWYNGA